MILFVALTLVLVGCGNTIAGNSFPAASGKAVVQTDAYPGVVVIYTPDSALCTGVKIAAKAVLTAAHCLKAQGTYTVTSKAGTFTTSNFYVNGDGSVGDQQDIGILVFSTTITTGAKNDLFSISNTVNANDAVTMVGAGCTSRTAETGAGIMRMAQNVIAQKNSDFLEIFSPTPVVASRGIGGDFSQGETCFGDSGGPLFNANNQVVGITHAGGTEQQGSNSVDISEFVNVADHQTNRTFISMINTEFNLGIQGF